jgi:hypothetical protein
LIASRFVPLLGLAAMTLAMLSNVKISAEATYLRAFRREPFLKLSLVVGGVQIVSALYFTKYLDILYITLVYSAIYIGIGLIWSRALFIRFRSEYKSI